MALAHALVYCANSGRQSGGVTGCRPQGFGAGTPGIGAGPLGFGAGPNRRRWQLYDGGGEGGGVITACAIIVAGPKASAQVPQASA